MTAVSGAIWEMPVIQVRTRPGRMREMAEYFRLDAETTVLDVGGTHFNLLRVGPMVPAVTLYAAQSANLVPSLELRT